MILRLYRSTDHLLPTKHLLCICMSHLYDNQDDRFCTLFFFFFFFYARMRIKCHGGHNNFYCVTIIAFAIMYIVTRILVYVYLPFSLHNHFLHLFSVCEKLYLQSNKKQSDIIFSSKIEFYPWTLYLIECLRVLIYLFLPFTRYYIYYYLQNFSLYSMAL